MDNQKRKLYRTLFHYKNRLKAQATPAERKFKDLLDERHIAYRFQKGIFTENANTLKKSFRIIDFYITRCRIGIEIDGGYHSTESVKVLDSERTAEIAKARRTLTIWRFTNDEVFANSKELIEKLDRLKIAQDIRKNKGVNFSEISSLLQ